MLHRIDNAYSYPRDQILSQHRQKGARSLGIILKSMFVVDSTYLPKEIIFDMTNRYKIDISFTQAWRAKMYAINALRGSLEESFILLPEYWSPWKYCHFNIGVSEQFT